MQKLFTFKMLYLSSFMTLLLMWTKYISAESEQNTRHCLDGPFNITRSVGENNVYIPCPFTGQHNPLWSVNEIYYEAQTLPRGMVAASHGLLIQTITETMNETTFQCFHDSGHSGIQNSSISTLTVEALQPVYQGFNSLVHQYNQTQRINLNHQRTFFNKSKKVFAWKGRSAICNNYRITSTTCDGIMVNQWEGAADRNTITVPTEELINGSHTEQPLLLLFSHDDEGNICQEANQYIQVVTSDVTNDIKVSPEGICIDIISESFPYIALPYSVNDTIDRPDCFCPIVIFSLSIPYNISQCNCVHQTQFSKSISASRISNTPSTYKICFQNLSSAINESVIHIFESFRYCENQYGRLVDINFRRYNRSFKILLGLASRPTVYFSHETGQVVFVSQHNHGILLDYYQVIVRDVSGEEVFNKIYSNTTNSTNVAERIQQSVCSPYVLIVQAHNFFGFSESDFIIESSTGTKDPCMCIKTNVIVDLSLDENGVQVNCSQPSNYESHVQLIISVNNQQNITITCDNDTQIVMYSSLDCDKHHLLHAYYEAPNSECTIAAKTEILSCQGDKIIILSATLGSTLGFFSLLLCIMCCILICRSRYCTGYKTLTINSDDS